MKCPNCGNQLKEGADFCGTCGAAVRSVPPPVVVVPTTSLYNNLDMPKASSPPNVPVTVSTDQHDAGPAGAPIPPVGGGGAKALVSLGFALLGLVLAFFVPVAGFVSAIVGLVLGTLSRRSNRRTISTVSTLLSGLVLVLSVASFSYRYSHSLKPTTTAATTTQTSASSVSTACYTAGFGGTLNIVKTNGSCDVNAFNGSNLASSHDAYKFLSGKLPSVNSGNFNAFAKQSLEKDFKNNLPDYTIDSERATTFAGSQAYVAYGSNASRGFAAAEEVVLHQSVVGGNVFVIVHLSDGTKTDLSTVESQWLWR